MFKFFRNVFSKKESLGLLAPDFRDSRDFLLENIQPVTVALPEEFDLRKDGYMSVQSQDGLGICYSFGSGGVKEFLDSREEKKQVNLSERFIVHYTKKNSGLWNQHGDYFRNALKAICEYGTPLEESYPNDYSLGWEKFSKEEPPDSVKKEALKYKGKTYWRVNGTLEDIRQAIFQQKCPVMTGMRWNKAYSVGKDGKLPLPDHARESGGHALMCVGWTKGKLWFKNSWGIGWGCDGYFYIPFDEFDKHEIWDNYVLLDVDAPEEIIGWSAGKYLKKVNGFVKGDKVEVTSTIGLRLREEPSSKGRKIKVLKYRTIVEVVGDAPVKADGYDWYKLKETKI